MLQVGANRHPDTNRSGFGSTYRFRVRPSDLIIIIIHSNYSSLYHKTDSPFILWPNWPTHGRPVGQYIVRRTHRLAPSFIFQNVQNTLVQGSNGSSGSCSICFCCCAPIVVVVAVVASAVVVALWPDSPLWLHLFLAPLV